MLRLFIISGQSELSLFIQGNFIYYFRWKNLQIQLSSRDINFSPIRVNLISTRESSRGNAKRTELRFSNPGTNIRYRRLLMWKYRRAFTARTSPINNRETVRLPTMTKKNTKVFCLQRFLADACDSACIVGGELKIVVKEEMKIEKTAGINGLNEWRDGGAGRGTEMEKKEN